MTVGEVAGRRCWRSLVALLLGLIATLAAILLGTTASASAAVGAETRVEAFNVAGEPLVGPPQHVSAGQGRDAILQQPQIVVATGVAANAAPKALPSGPKITAQWGADTYRHGGLMSTIEHINYRHAYNTGFSGVSRYAQGTSARDIKGYVDYVLRNGAVTDRGMIGNVRRTIGYDRAGNPVSGLEIIIRDGMIKTAYPVGVP